MEDSHSGAPEDKAGTVFVLLDRLAMFESGSDVSWTHLRFEHAVSRMLGETKLWLHGPMIAPASTAVTNPLERR